MKAEQLKAHYYTVRSSAIEYLQHWTPLPDNPVLVYSMRKVASTTVTSTLRSAGYPVYKHHCIDPALNADFQEALSRTGFERQHWLSEGARFQKRLAQWRARQEDDGQRRRLRVFTLVRDPMAIALSDYFMQLFDFMPEAVAKKNLDRLERLQRYFQEVLEAGISGGSTDPVTNWLGKLGSMPRLWFDREFKKTMGIDVLETPFPKERGYAVYHGHDSDTVLIRSDFVSRVALDAITVLTDHRPAALMESNIRSQDAHGDLYRSLVETISLPASLVHDFYRQPWISHFYNGNEIEGMIKRWQRQA